MKFIVLQLMSLTTLIYLLKLSEKWEQDPTQIDWKKLIMAEKLIYFCFFILWFGAYFTI